MSEIPEKPELLILVKRQTLTPESTVGELLLNGQHFCYTLEPPIKPTGAAKPFAIPAGSYDVTVRLSPRFERLMPHVENVPGFDGILIHAGNKADDTQGCLLVGMHYAPNWISSSRMAFDDLFERIREAKEWGDVYITYVDPAVSVAT